MDYTKQLLIKTEEMERQLATLENKIKKKLNLLSFKYETLSLSGGLPEKAAGFKITAPCGEAVVFAGFYCQNINLNEVTIQLIVNGLIVAEKKLPASSADSVYIAFKKTLFNLQAADFTLEFKTADTSDVIFDNVEIDVFACDAVKIGEK